jgi:hypothetical protein
MSTFLSTSQVQQVQAAANYLLTSVAYETPDHPDFIQRLEAVAVSSGFSPNVGRFRESMKLKPASTMALFLAYVGGNAASQANTQSAPTLPVP